MGKKPVTKKEFAKLKNSKLISKYHAANKAKKTNGEEEVEELGGFEGYQAASLYGAKYGNTSKWLLRHIWPLKNKLDARWRLLDVGALAFNYLNMPWIDAEAIDLRPILPGIRKIDFMEYPIDSKKDVICLSLVLNFVGDPYLRGQMIERCWDLLDTAGFLYVVLPKSTINHSRFMTVSYFTEILKHFGFYCIHQHMSPKLAYFLGTKGDKKLLEAEEPKIQMNGYNNFKIKIYKT